MTAGSNQQLEGLLRKMLSAQLSDAEMESPSGQDGKETSQPEHTTATAGNAAGAGDDDDSCSGDPAASYLLDRLVEHFAAPGLALALSDDRHLQMGSASSATGIPKQLEYFRILKVLGEGGMGRVYLAEDTRLGRQVALKTLKAELAARPGAKERFLREAQSAATLAHDHIVPIYYVGMDDGTPFIAMPFLKGEALDSRLRTDRPPRASQADRARASSGTFRMTIAEAVRIGREIAMGLAAAHECGLIHRDIKPGNIWLEAPDGRVKILDFGLVQNRDQDNRLTAHGTLLGTPAYMAPEQVCGSRIDPRADLFSLGCILYEMLTGVRPFMGENTLLILSRLANYTPPPPLKLNPECPKGLSDLVMRLLEKKPEDRPAGAQLVADALGDFDWAAPAGSAASAELSKGERDAGARQSRPASTTKSGPRKRPGLGRKRTAFVVIACAIMAMGGLGFQYGAQVIRFVRDQAELVVEIDDPALEVRVVQDGIVLHDKTQKREFSLKPGSGEIEVLEKDGIKLATKKFELTRGRKSIVKVTIQDLSDARVSKVPAKVTSKHAGVEDQDRQAAEWALSIGGSLFIRQNGPARLIRPGDGLPKEKFSIFSVILDGNRTALDAELARLKDCQDLRVLSLNRTRVTDLGLAHFEGVTTLTALRLIATKVGDSGLAHFKGCRNLAELRLGGTLVTDKGLSHFAGCKGLDYLGLASSAVTDAGLVHFKDCDELTGLDLSGTAVGDGSLAYFKNCKGLKQLFLAGTQVTDLGLANLKECPNLALLDLAETKITDAGLGHLKECTRLSELMLTRTRITDKGLQQLSNCKQLSALLMADTMVSDSGIESLVRLPGLKRIDLRRTRVSAAGIGRLQKALPECTVHWRAG